MKAIEQAIAHYRERGFSAAAFCRDMARCAREGALAVTDNFFVMARKVRADAPAARIFDPCARFENPDTWFIHLFVGDLGRVACLFDLAPHPLPFAAWRRDDGVLRIFDTQTLRERLKYGIRWQ